MRGRIRKKEEGRKKEEINKKKKIGVLQLRQRDSARHPSDHATRAVDKEGDTDEESSEGDECGVEWKCTSWEWDGSPQNKESGSVSQLRWTREQQKTFYQQTPVVV